MFGKRKDLSEINQLHEGKLVTDDCLEDMSRTMFKNYVRIKKCHNVLYKVQLNRSHVLAV